MKEWLIYFLWGAEGIHWDGLLHWMTHILVCVCICHFIESRMHAWREKFKKKRADKKIHNH